MSDLRKIRLQKKLTQKQAADRIGVSLRSYVTYENDKTKENTPKYRFLISEMQKINPLDEEHGILTITDIRNICDDLFQNYPVNFCYLFGSYAKGNPNAASDVDLLISTPVTGLRYFELTEQLRERLHKRVDLLDAKQLLGNENLLNEVLQDGVKIYG